MPKALIQVGTRWGRLLCTDIYAQEVEGVEEGIEYTETITYFRMKCDCGKVVDIPKRDWKGKREIQDCGTCGLSLQREAKELIQAHVPASIFHKVMMGSRALNCSRSQWVLDAILLRIELEQQQKQQTNGQQTAKEIG